MIIFDSVKFKNFLSYGNNFTEILLNQDRTTLLSGKNGHGKSCMIDSIVFALYGKPFRKINKAGLINSINKSELVVELEFSEGNNKYKIIRGIKPNIFELYKNSVLVKQDAKVKDYQEYLERYILKTSYKSFIQVVILGSARYTPFMQLSASDRRSVIEDLLDIQIFSNMNSIVKDKLSSIKESIQQCKFNIDLVKNNIELQKHNILEHKKSSHDIIDKKKIILDNTLSEISTIESTVKKVQQKNSDLSIMITDKSNVESKQQKFNSIENKIHTNVSKLSKENIFYEFNDNCPTCRQTIDSTFKSLIVSDNTKKIEELNIGKQKLSSELENIKHRLIEISSINNVISNNNIEIAKLTSSITSAQKYILVVSKELEDLHSSTDTLAQDNYKLQELVETLDTYVETYEENITEKSYYDFIGLMLKDGGIKTNIIKQYLPILNKYINQYLTQLDFFVNFNINEKFEEIIKSRHRDEFTYANFSEGEKMRLDLAILFSFRQLAKIKNSVNTNLLILDEVMDGSLDSSGTDVFMNLLSSVDSGTNIFVISHNTEQISDKFDTTLTFEKIKNFSKMKKA